MATRFAKAVHHLSNVRQEQHVRPNPKEWSERSRVREEIRREYDRLVRNLDTALASEKSAVEEIQREVESKK